MIDSPMLRSGVPEVVGIAERNPVLATGLRSILLENGMSDVRLDQMDGGFVADIAQLAACEVVVFDPRQLDVSLTEFVTAVREIHEPTAFVGYSFDMSREEIAASCALGRFCFVCKSDDPEQLILGIISAAQGSVFVSRAISGALSSDSVVRPVGAVPNGLADKLSPRERAVLLSFARGLGIKQISQEMRLSERTVNTYKSRAAKKLNLGDRSEIVQYALDNNLI